jgi:hypothetical protein
MEKTIANEILLTIWVFLLLYSVVNKLPDAVVIILGIQVTISIIATIIQSYKQHGTKQR